MMWGIGQEEKVERPRREAQKHQRQTYKGDGLNDEEFQEMIRMKEKPNIIFMHFLTRLTVVSLSDWVQFQCMSV